MKFSPARIVLLLAAFMLPMGSTAQESKPKTRPMVIPEGTTEAMARDAAKVAVEKLWKSMLEQSSQMPKRFAILPPPRDIGDGFTGDQLRNQFTRLAGPTGLELYTRMDGEWTTLLEEIKWGQDFGDTMDPATVQKFGRIQGVQALINTKMVAITAKENGGAKVEISAQVFEVETGRLLWGGDASGEIDGTFDPMAPAALKKEYGRYLPWAIGGIVGLIVLLMLFGAARRAVGRASRPR